MGENGIAKPEDFRALWDRTPAERVVLPKLGMAVLLRRPTPMWFLFRGQLPVTLAARLQSGGASLGTIEDLQALADWIVPLLAHVFVEPKLALHPGPGEISPDLLDIEDASFVIRWAVGEVTGLEDGGQGITNDLRPFRGEPESVAAGAGGGDLELPAQ